MGADYRPKPAPRSDVRFCRWFGPLFPITDLPDGPPVRLQLTHNGSQRLSVNALFQLLQQRLGVLQIGGVEPLGELVLNARVNGAATAAPIPTFY